MNLGYGYLKIRTLNSDNNWKEQKKSFITKFLLTKYPKVKLNINMYHNALASLVNKQYNFGHP